MKCECMCVGMLFYSYKFHDQQLWWKCFHEFEQILPFQNYTKINRKTRCRIASLHCALKILYLTKKKKYLDKTFRIENNFQKKTFRIQNCCTDSNTNLKSNWIIIRNFSFRAKNRPISCVCIFCFFLLFGLNFLEPFP